MNSQVLILLVVVAVIVVAAVVVVAVRKRRSQSLREQFGPEYDRVVRKEGDVHKGEQTLAFRQKHRKALEIKPIRAVCRISLK